MGMCVVDNIYHCTCDTDISNTYRTPRAMPVPGWDGLQGRVEAVRVVSRRADVAAEQLSTVLTDAAELHVVILLLLLDPARLLDMGRTTI